MRACIYILGFDFFMQSRPTASDRGCKGGCGNDTSSQPAHSFLANAMTRCSIRDRSESWIKIFCFALIVSCEKALTLGYRLPTTYLADQGT